MMNNISFKKDIPTGSPHRIVLDLEGFDRIRRRSPAHLNERVIDGIEERIQFYAHQNTQSVSERIDRLDREWDIDRSVMLFFSVLGSTFFALGMTRNRKFLWPLAVQLPFLAYHAAAGWCPPMALFRRLGFRTQREIDAEKYALKTLRGDYWKNHKAGSEAKDSRVNRSPF